MNKQLTTLGLFVLVLLLIFASFIMPSMSSSSTRATELEGKWVGNETTGGDSDDPTPWVWNFTGNTVEIKSFDNESVPVEEYNGTYTIDTSKSPNHIDITITSHNQDEPWDGEVSLGMYEIIGNNLTVIINEPGNPDRPPSITGKQGRRWNLISDKPINGNGGNSNGDGNGTGDGNDTKKDDDKDSGFLPGFEIAGLGAALFAALIITRKRRK